MRTTLLSLLLVAACQPAPDDGAPIDTGTQGPFTDPETEPEEEESSTPYVYEDDGEEGTLLSLEDMQASVAEAIDVVLHIDPKPLWEIYEGARGESDGDCPYYYPEYYTTYGYWYWYDTCTTDGGSRFAGNGRSYVYLNDRVSTYNYDWRSYFYGSATVTTADGHVFVGAGYSSAYEALNDNGYYYYYQNTYGDFRWDGPEAAGTWLADDLGVATVLSASRHPVNGVAISIQSSLAGLRGPANAAVLDGVYMYSELRGSPCPIEPSGTISLRDANGSWVDLEFQGPDAGATAMFPPDCDGCGQAYFRGELLGEVCPDFSKLLEWEDRPWR